jgi:lipid-A-disaccharide synthase
MDKPVVKELVQKDFTAANVSAELELLLNDEAYRERIRSDYKAVQDKLGGPGASRRLAEHLTKDAVTV